MGAFFLYKDGHDVDLKSVKSLFLRKGFSDPTISKLGVWRLFSYRKILLDDLENFVRSEGGSVFCSGTLSYRGLGYRDSLRCLLRDFLHEALDQNELIGHFALIFWNGITTSILTDQLNTYHVFIDAKADVISSSFLATVVAQKRPLALNRLAVCEKLSFGIIVGSDTLVDGISRIDDDLASSISNETHEIAFMTHAARPPIELHDSGIEESLERQISALQAHFRKLNSLDQEFTGELGISDGFDSRLLLACSRWVDNPLALHTHSSPLKAHQESRALVEQIASQVRCGLRVVPTRNMFNLPDDEVNKLLNDNLYYFDGRCSYNMGAFSEVYTRRYRKDVLGDGLRFSLNGLGGELYRNVYDVRRAGMINFRKWSEFYDMYAFAKEAVGDNELFNEMLERRSQKIFKRLPVSKPSHVNFLWIRRYYSEIRMCDGDSNNSDAQNQLSFYHMPFIQPRIIYEGIDATPYIGSGASYQMRLLQKISPELARFSSHYGYPMDAAIPPTVRVKQYIKELSSSRIRQRRRRRIIPISNRENIQKTRDLIDRCPILSEGKERLVDGGIVKDFERAIWDNTQRATTAYLGAFLGEFAAKLRL